jgi:hypothetical protein
VTSFTVAMPSALPSYVLDVVVERLLDLDPDERRPARVAVLAREHELRARELHRQVAESRDCPRIALARSTDELLGLLLQLLDVHADLLPRGPRPRSGGKKIGSVLRSALRWAQPCPRTGCALTRSRRIA